MVCLCSCGEEVVRTRGLIAKGIQALGGDTHFRLFCDHRNRISFSGIPAANGRHTVFSLEFQKIGDIEQTECASTIWFTCRKSFGSFGLSDVCHAIAYQALTQDSDSFPAQTAAPLPDPLPSRHRYASANLYATHAPKGQKRSATNRFHQR